MSDADLVARARQGDAAAFGELVDRHRASVYRAAMAALGSHADAEDAAQDAFLLAYRRLASFRGDASFKTWLLSIAWHQAINRRRTLTRLWKRLVNPPREELEGQDAILSSVPASGPTPEAAALDGEQRRAVAAEIRALSPKLRDALLLAQSGEYSYEEISVLVKAPIGTVKWRVSEARRIVKQRLVDRGLRSHVER